MLGRLIVTVSVAAIKLLFLLSIFGGGLFLATTLNTSEFPWGAVSVFVLTLPFIIWCGKIILNKRLTRSQKWDKLLGLH